MPPGLFVCFLTRSRLQHKIQLRCRVLKSKVPWCDLQQMCSLFFDFMPKLVYTAPATVKKKKRLGGRERCWFLKPFPGKWLEKKLRKVNNGKYWISTRIQLRGAPNKRLKADFPKTNGNCICRTVLHAVSEERSHYGVLRGRFSQRYLWVWPLKFDFSAE